MGRLIVLSVVVLLCFLASSRSLAQSDPELAVKPDRPSFTNGIQIVPLGHFQVESGATGEFTGSDRNLWIGELTVRVPVSKSIEFRGLIGTYGHSTSGGETRKGFTNVLLDAKVRLIDTETSDFGFIAGAIVPVGSNDFRQHHLQPYMTLCFEHPISETIGLTANTGIVYRSVSGEQLAQVYGGAGLTFDVASRVSLYGEIYTWSRGESEGKTETMLGTGVQWMLSDRVALDGRVGIGIGETASDWFTGLGASLLF